MGYSYGAGWDDDVLAEFRTESGATVTLYYLKDRLGSTAAVTDSSGSVLEEYRYSAFGSPYRKIADGSWEALGLETETLSGTVRPEPLTERLYTGREWDSETGLHHYRARTYSPELGRFLQRDPVGTADQVNPYAYVRNNPLAWTDPTGMISCPITEPKKFIKEVKDYGNKAVEAFNKKFRPDHYKRFKKMSGYINSPEYQIYISQSTNTEILDALWMYSKSLSDDDNRVALGLMMDTVRSGRRFQYGETKEEATMRLVSLPSGLNGEYSVEYGNRDKLQHFFKSAQISYNLSVLPDVDMGGAAVGMLGFAKEVSDEVISTGFDQNDINANAQGAKYGKYLRRYEKLPEDTYPSFVTNIGK